MLALGIAVQVARSAQASPTTWVSRMRVGAIALAVFAIVAGVSVRVIRMSIERTTVSSLAAAPANAPNVLFIVWDTVRRMDLSLYGYARATTPRLDRIARDGAVFEEAYSPAPWTLPSHASMFTGRAPGALGSGFLSPLPSEYPTLAEVLQARGYMTGGFVGNLLYTSYESGLARGFAHFEDYRVSLAMIVRHASIGRTKLVVRLAQSRTLRDAAKVIRAFELLESRVPADVVGHADDLSAAFLKWQHAVGPRPFMAFLNFYDAHGPAKAPAAFKSKFVGGATPRLDEYDASIAYLDHVTGAILDSLDRRGVLRNTIVVITSDHGEHFGEHKLNGHANSLYLPLLAVPLLIRFPDSVPADLRVPSLVSTRDLAATILDLAGAGRGLPGTSLALAWRSPGANLPPLIVAELEKGINVDSSARNSRGPLQAILTDRLHFVRNSWGPAELYAYRTDSLELKNLASDPAFATDLARLRAQMDSAIGPVRAPD
jgi:arylsulfatase A-like enzyme